MAKVSVIIPIYGVENFIERCAHSLFNQTLDDIEYIFIDDCTLDRSIEKLNNVLLQYPHRKKQTRILKMPVNSGQAAVRQYGIQMATGNYIIHCDSDDWVDVNAYEKMYQKAIKDDYDVVFCDYYLTDGNSHKRVKRDFKSLSKRNIIYVVVQQIYWQLWSAMVKKNIFSDNEIIYPTANNGEDFALMVQILYYANKYTHINQPLYFYFQNENSITKTKEYKNYIKRADEAQRNTNLVIEFYRKKKEESIYHDIIIMFMLYTRRTLSSLTCFKKYREIWFSIYPELEHKGIFFNKNIPLNLKLNYYSIKTNTYKLLKNIQCLFKLDKPI